MKRRLRRRSRWLYGLITGVTSVGLVVGPGQTAAAQEHNLAIDTVDSSEYPQVTLTVEPPEGLAEVDLTTDDFTLSENGEQVPVEVTRVAGEATSSEVLEVALVIDTSGSMQGEPLEAARSAATAFVNQLPSGTRITVVTFGDTPAVASPLSGDPTTALQALGGLQAQGETALYDAIDTAAAQFTVDDSVRKAMVLLSDGGDTASQYTLDQVLAGLGDWLDFAAVELVTSEYDGTALRTITQATGGTLLSADEPGKLAAVYDTVASNLLNRYHVTYTSQSGGDTSVALTVAAADITAEASRNVRLPEQSASAAATAPREETASGPGWLGTNTALVFGLALLFITLSLLFGWLFAGQREARVHLSDRFGSAGEGISRMRDRLPAFSSLAERASHATQRQLERRGRDKQLNATLERAGIDLRPGEFIAMAGASGIAALFLGTLLAGPLVGIPFAALVLGGFAGYLKFKAHRRSSKFSDQLSDTLQLITGNLRAGHSILQAIDSVGHDSQSPTREEFQRLVTETRLGRDLPDALWAMHARIGNQDFEWFVQALKIHREVGGDLAEILDTVAETVRERTRLRRHISALSAEGRLSAVILFILPIAMIGVMSVLNPDYMSELFDSTLGIGMLFAGGMFMTFGAFWLRKIIRIEL